MNLLASREHSRAELYRKLLQRFGSPLVVDQALQQLMAEGLQSDTRFTEVYIRVRAERGYGPIRIECELKERGIAEAVIDEFLNRDESEWFQRAKIVWQKKYGKGIPSSYAEQAKQMRFLQYRGFTLPQINAVMKENN